jgi:peptidyl-tRNA hydrolase, PTH1 family
MKPNLIIIGLGNPGKDYEQTRHNVGFAALEKIGEKFGVSDWQPNQKFLADVMEADISGSPTLLVKPVTYMNRSGECIKKIIDFYKLDNNQVIVITDDIDLEVGKIRMKELGGAGSHNGLKSIVEQIGEEFPRIRIGIRGETAPESGSFQQAGVDLSSYVLSRPTEGDREKIDDALEEVLTLISG